MTILRGIWIASLALILAAGSASAATVDPLNLPFGLFPDVRSNLSVTNTVNGSGWQMTITGSNDQLGLPDGSDRTKDGLVFNVFDSGPFTNDFALIADFDDNGDFVGGTITLSGFIATADSFPNAFVDPNSGQALEGVLLSGNLLDFGLDQSVRVLEFAFDADEATPLGFYGLGAGLRDGGFQIALDSIAGEPTDWADMLTRTAFTASGFSNTNVVAPLPGAVWLFASALMGGAGLRRLRRRG